MREEDCRKLGEKLIRREDLICKIFDAVRVWTNGCYKCMYDQQFLFMLAMMDEEALQRFLDKEEHKTLFKMHGEGTRIHDLKIF